MFLLVLRMQRHGESHLACCTFVLVTRTEGDRGTRAQNQRDRDGEGRAIGKRESLSGKVKRRKTFTDRANVQPAIKRRCTIRPGDFEERGRVKRARRPEARAAFLISAIMARQSERGYSDGRSEFNRQSR